MNKKNKRLNTLEKIEQFFTKELPKLVPDGASSHEESFENSKRFLQKLGNPQNTHSTIHVAGTSGKGTVCYMIDAILRAHNKRSALLVSPHVYEIRERIQINGQFIPERHFISQVNEILDQLRSLPEKDRIGYYRLMSVLGFIGASRSRLDYVVVETSMGGRYDTTNTITRDDTVPVLTQIGLDHPSQLGSTYEQIALEKSGIVRPGRQAIVLRQKETVNLAFENIFNRQNSSIHWVNATENYLINDTLLAYAATEHIAKRDGWQFNDEKARLAVNSVYIPGRFEKRLFDNKLVILDGAHNPQKINALCWRLENEDIQPATFLLALGTKKDYEKILTTIKPLAARVICTEFFTSQPSLPIKATPAEMLAAKASEIGIGQVEAIKNPLDALRKAAKYDETIVATGSFYLLSEIDNLF